MNTGSGSDDLAISCVEDEIVAWRDRRDLLQLVSGLFQTLHGLNPNGLTIRQSSEDVELRAHAYLHD